MKELSLWRLDLVRKELPNQVLGYFGDRNQAVEAQYGSRAREAGCNRDIVPVTVNLYDSAIDYDPTLDKSARASGLAKLTKVERAALGLPTEDD